MREAAQQPVAEAAALAIAGEDAGEMELHGHGPGRTAVTASAAADEGFVAPGVSVRLAAGAARRGEQPGGHSQPPSSHAPRDQHNPFLRS